MYDCRSIPFSLSEKIFSEEIRKNVTLTMGFIMAGSFYSPIHKETPPSIYSTGYLVHGVQFEMELQEKGDTRGHIVFTPMPS